MTAKNLALTTYTATGATTKRTQGDRAADEFNVMDFGALGDGSGALLSTRYGSLGAAQAVYSFATALTQTIDWAAIQAAVNAAYARTYKSCIVKLPPGNFNVGGDTVDIASHVVGSNGTSGIIRGSGRWCTYINGNIGTGFIFSQADGLNGPEEISDLSLVNTSTVIGTGALMLNNNTCGVVRNCHFGGMINILMPYNIFQTTITNCTGESNSNLTTGHVGTFGIAGFHCNVEGWRTTSNYQAGIQFYGTNSASIRGCGIENCTTAYVVGMQTGWASQCTVNGTELTIGGSLGTLDGPGAFAVGTEIFMDGLSTIADWGILPIAASRCVITETHAENGSRTGTGFAGTYTISRSATISSPVPCVTRKLATISGTTWQALTSEACYYIMFVYGASGNTFSTIGGGSTVTECVNAFGSSGLSATAGFYLYAGIGGSTFVSCAPSNNPTLASWYIEPATDQDITFVSCLGQKVTDTVTATSSSISNGSGGAGTILNVVSAPTGGFVGIGCRAFVSGVQVGVVIGNSSTDGTLTGAGGLGTYRVDTSQLVTGQAITIKWGDDWVMPTSSSAKTALNFFNNTSANLPPGYTTGLDSLNRTFTSLPGQAGANSNFPVHYGMEYDITDGRRASDNAAITTAMWGVVVTGGGSSHVRVRYNGTSWTVVGM